MATAIHRHPRTLNELKQHEAALTDPDVILLGSTVHIVRLKRFEPPQLLRRYRTLGLQA